MERILCAAIEYDGLIIANFRHGNCIATLKTILMPYTTFEQRELIIKKLKQGFLTNKNRFVDRVEGNRIAIIAKQVTGNEDGDELISEDLY